MADPVARLVVDCSVVVKWKIPLEDHAAAAEQLLLDWEHRAVSVSAPNHLQSEIISAFLRAHRRGRITAEEAREAIQDLLALPFVLFDVAPIAERAFAIARQHNQRSYDCLYVALADREGGALWTGDRRLYNALHPSYEFVRWIGEYQSQRPTEEGERTGRPEA
ncbi:MAG: type II toxin-antitoxin system VapC family toxin [Nitrospinae bacterium]|nr:type II toxin-antitoxin system VapC family toxin [Nitrospinota bacterium]